MYSMVIQIELPYDHAIPCTWRANLHVLKIISRSRTSFLAWSAIHQTPNNMLRHVCTVYSSPRSSFQLSGPWSSKFGGHSPVGHVDVQNSNESEWKDTLHAGMFNWRYNIPVPPEVVHKDAPSIPWLQRPKWPPRLCQWGSRGPKHAGRAKDFWKVFCKSRSIYWNTCTVATIKHSIKCMFERIWIHHATTWALAFQATSLSFAWKQCPQRTKLISPFYNWMPRNTGGSASCNGLHCTVDFRQETPRASKSTLWPRLDDGHGHQLQHHFHPQVPGSGLSSVNKIHNNDVKD